MTRIRKSAAVFALSVASIGAWVGGNALVRDVRFASAEEKVQLNRQELQSVQDLSSVFRTVGKAVEPSVVQIEVRKSLGSQAAPDSGSLRKFFRDHGLDIPDDNGESPMPSPDQGGEEVGTGSGVIVETQGDDVYILTNNHVAGDAQKITVTLSDKRVIHNGKVIGNDPKADLAVVKITADHVIPAKWGDSDLLDRGDWVLAFGSPFGYVGSMTHGIVSALDRQAGILGNQGYEDFIQVDAPINPGNSGGPLVNIHGEVVGINTAIASRSGGFQGIGFAIPSNEAHKIYDILKTKGKVTRGWLGVKIEDVERAPELAKSFGYNGDTGVIVQDVLSGTPSTGKLQDDDVITAINGKKVNDVQQLRNAVAFIAPGETAKLNVFRNNKDTEVDIKMGEQPDDTTAMMSPAQDNADSKGSSAEVVKSLGLRLTDVTDELADKYKLGDIRKGALIIDVKPESIAAQAGLFPGSVITKINGRSVTDAAAAVDELSNQDLKKGFRVRVVNAEGSEAVYVQQQ